MTLGLYIQVPFCQTKCTYCNFHTGVVSRDRYQPYANAVCREIAGVAEPRQPSADTVYFGGGTPSLLDPPPPLSPKSSTHYAPPTRSKLPKSPSKPTPKQSRPKKPNPGSPPASIAS